MLVCRFFLGFFGAASINNVPASIGDFTFPHNRNRYSVSPAFTVSLQQTDARLQRSFTQRWHSVDQLSDRSAQRTSSATLASAGIFA